MSWIELKDRWMPEMHILSIERDLAWLPHPNEVSFVLTDQAPPLPLITSALALIFQGEDLLMTRLCHRGWDIPGGHIEAGETPEQAMRREVLEETGVTVGEASLLGYQHIHLTGSMPQNYKYPCPDSYQLIYFGHIAAMNAFQATPETHERSLLTPEDARKTRWVQQNQSLYEHALKLAKQTLDFKN